MRKCKIIQNHWLWRGFISAGFKNTSQFNVTSRNSGKAFSRKSHIKFIFMICPSRKVLEEFCSFCDSRNAVICMFKIVKFKVFHRLRESSENVQIKLYLPNWSFWIFQSFVTKKAVSKSEIGEQILLIPSKSGWITGVWWTLARKKKSRLKIISRMDVGLSIGRITGAAVVVVACVLVVGLVVGSSVVGATVDAGGSAEEQISSQFSTLKSQQLSVKLSDGQLQFLIASSQTVPGAQSFTTVLSKTSQW